MAIRKFHSPEVDDLAGWQPADPDEFAVLLQVIGGPEGTIAEESFDTVVLTPTALARQAQEFGPVIGRHYLIVKSWHWPTIEGFIKRFAATCEGPSWDVVAEKMGRLGKWEFEDYVPTNHTDRPQTWTRGRSGRPRRADSYD